MNFSEVKNYIMNIVDKKIKIMNDKIDLFINDFSNFKEKEIKRDISIEDRLKKNLDKNLKDINYNIDKNLKKINQVSSDINKKIENDYIKLKDEIYQKISNSSYEFDIQKLKKEIEEIKDEIKEIKDDLKEIKVIFE